MLPELSSLDRGTKNFVQGTHRTISPKETLQRVWELRRVFGITRVADVTGLDTLGIPVVNVYRPNSRSLVVAQGKGASVEAAQASGLMESIESWHAERIHRPLKLASYEELRFDHTITQMDGLVRPTQSTFHPRQKLLWIEGWDLAQQTSRWLPYECVHLDCTLPLPTGSGAFCLASNGLASGNHRLEAIAHGICEVIERDAATLWYIGPQEERWKLRRLDLHSLSDAMCSDMVQRMEDGGLLVGAWDITSDIGVPTYACAIVDEKNIPGSIQYATSGLGCHLSPQIALLRALTEAAQCRLTYISGARDDSDRAIYERARNAQALEELREHIRSTATSTAKLSDHPDNAQQDFLQDVEYLVTQLTQRGLFEVITVDLSRPGLDLAVERVVIPGLEGSHDFPGIALGHRAAAKLARRNSP